MFDFNAVKEQQAAREAARKPVKFKPPHLYDIVIDVTEPGDKPFMVASIKVYDAFNPNCVKCNHRFHYSQLTNEKIETIYKHYPKKNSNVTITDKANLIIEQNESREVHTT